jgi:tetratricopeptide (TPR) repeat protein
MFSVSTSKACNDIALSFLGKKEMDEVYVKVNMSKTKKEKITVLENLAEEYMSFNKFDYAISVYNEILKLKWISKKQRFKYYVKLGDIYAIKRNYVFSIENYKKALSLYKKDIYVRIKIGDMFLKSRLYDLAENAFIEALKIDKNSNAVKKGLGDVFYEQDFYSKAVNYYNKIEYKDYDKETIIKVATCYQNLNKIDEAINILKIFAKPEETELIFFMGLLYMDKSEYNKAKALFLSLIENGVKNFKLCIYLAYIYDLQGENEQAKKMFDEVFKMNPSCAVVNYILAEINYKMGNLNESKKYAKKAYSKANTIFMKAQTQKLIKFLNERAS